jgi:hypothetical protein
VPKAFEDADGSPSWDGKPPAQAQEFRVLDGVEFHGCHLSHVCEISQTIAMAPLWVAVADQHLAAKFTGLYATVD